jgi:Tfp pilus assembly protein PilN
MIRINLLPSKKARGKRETGLHQLIAFMILILAAGGGLFYWYNMVEDEITTEGNLVAARRSEVDKLKKAAGELVELEKREKDIRERLKQIDDLQKSRTGPVRMLAEFSRRIPSRVWVNSIVEKDHKMKVSGAGLSYEDIAEFMKGLRESGYFFKIKDLGQENKPSPIPGLNFVEFKLECETKYAI